MTGARQSPPFRVGLVGTGGIARAHGAACRALDGVELAAICDVSEAALERYGDEFGVSRRYRGVDEMVADQELDIVVICIWGAYHAEVGVQVARSGRVKAILCEKPFTSTAAEAEQLVAAAREGGVLIAEAFKFRHHPMHLRAKELIDAGAIGEVMDVRSTFCMSGDPVARGPERNWRWNRAKGGGSIYDLACYNVHHARFIFGAEPERVFATARMEGEVDVAASLLLEFPRGRCAQISVGYDSWEAQYADIAGTGGMLKLGRVWNNDHQAVTMEQHTGSGRATIEFPPAHQFALQLGHLCECLATGAPHRISPENSIAQMRVIDAIFESIRTGRTVTLAAAGAPPAVDASDG